MSIRKTEDIFRFHYVAVILRQWTIGKYEITFTWSPVDAITFFDARLFLAHNLNEIFNFRMPVLLIVNGWILDFFCASLDTMTFFFSLSSRIFKPLTNRSMVNSTGLRLEAWCLRDIHRFLYNSVFINRIIASKAWIEWNASMDNFSSSINKKSMP